jgi:NTE family protein
MKDSKTVNLVLEGGGVKGIGLVGAIEELETAGYSWDYIGGTSAGAIVATLLAVGYTGRELYEVISGTDLDFINIMDDVPVRQDFFKVQKRMIQAIEKRGFFGILFSVLRTAFQTRKLVKRLQQNYGLFNGEYIVEKVRDLIEKKTGSRHYTFADLAKANDGDATKLSLMVTDITNGRLLILPRDLPKLHRSPDQMEIVQAMRMSMSFPFFFKPVRVRIPDREILLMDGGVLSNFPYWYIDGLAETSRKPHPTVGILLEEPPGAGIKDLWGIITALLNTMISPLDRAGHRALSNRIVKVTTIVEEDGQTRNISTLAFDLGQKDKDLLYNNGRKAVREFIPMFERATEKEKSAVQIMKDWAGDKSAPAAAA